MTFYSLLVPQVKAVKSSWNFDAAAAEAAGIYKEV
jgi:hypothetical protein